MLLQADAAGDTNTSHWAGPHSTTIHTPSLLLSVHFLLTWNINVSSLRCCCVSPPHFSLSLRLPSPDLGAAWTSSGGPGVRCQLLFKLFFMLYSHLLYNFYTLFCILDLVGSYLFAFPLFTLCPASLSFSVFTRPTPSKMIPPRKLGPAQGFFLLKGSFSLPLTWGVRALGFGLCKAPRDTCIVKDNIQANKLKLGETSPTNLRQFQVKDNILNSNISVYVTILCTTESRPKQEIGRRIASTKAPRLCRFLFQASSGAPDSTDSNYWPESLDS